MRGASIFTAVVVAVGTVSACGSSSEATKTTTNDPQEGGAVDADYCEKYCAAEASSGTSTGTKAACLTDCCKSVPAGCSVDASAPVADATVDVDDSGADASVCAIPCGTSCCAAGQGCGVDGSGQKSCVATCTNGADCTTGCCAPATNADGDPVGPYTCKPDDGKAYDCCTGFVSCDSPACCIVDTKGNQFCSPQCTGNAQCGAGHCQGYEFSLAHTTCSGPLACGP